MKIGRGDVPRRQMALNSNAMMLQIELNEEEKRTITLLNLLGQQMIQVNVGEIIVVSDGPLPLLLLPFTVTLLCPCPRRWRMEVHL